ncbi:LOW QUALITY PROTEIN: uncharacterized protein LOC113857254 [Abrus precatorius]|uniref:LOW QUALITY PROTEIN: uncharacterized protein LOC113857254 n=1 Tax=Abrus precatorius TaxID=3816 RepID=A0A8B8KQ95_ABRPR|nr:LOW QUALITY PROTEIN: uncharacterized protein LOC113857254 [Abrus precatorius]
MIAAATTTASPPIWWRQHMQIEMHHRRVTASSFSRRMNPPFPNLRGLGLYRNGAVESSCGAVSRSNQWYVSVSPWDDKPFEMLPNGKKVYLDEQDVVTFLDPPKELIPLDPSSYNPAAYLWKKIEDIPEERRHRLLLLLKPRSFLFSIACIQCLFFFYLTVGMLISLCRLVSMAWQIAGTRYEDPKLVKKSASTLLSNSNKDDVMLEYYNCRTSGGTMPISWINSFRKAIFSCKDGQAYGRIIYGPVLAAFTDSFTPLYFTVRQLKEVMSTEQPCDLAYEFGDGLHDIKELPLGFPRPVKHPYPFNDQIVMYVRFLAPGVAVGQAWQEGTKLEQVPRKLCREILMVKDYTSLPEDL